ncbi:AMP-binding enzyme, partial [Mycolicibacterium septicum]|uniref:AMP-binding enzyme n=1 Tax=Mycolicibacterium septicum TaxID=98668 RepID=UPI0039088CEA
ATLAPDDIRDYVRANLARYKIPRDVEFLSRLPRNATGKVLRGGGGGGPQNGGGGGGGGPQNGGGGGGGGGPHGRNGGAGIEDSGAGPPACRLVGAGSGAAPAWPAIPIAPASSAPPSTTPLITVRPVKCRAITCTLQSSRHIPRYREAI